MAQDWISPITLTARAASLVPLSPDHAGALCAAAGPPETFRYFFWIPEPYDAGGFRERIEQTLALPGAVAFTVIDNRTGDPVGMTCYLDIQPAHRKLEIGSTWLSPSSRGTSINPEMKMLMLRHAFEDRGAHRVFLKTHSGNAHSRRAIEKLGANFEGVLREDMLMHDSTWRSTAYYSILESEWPAVREKLNARISR